MTEYEVFRILKKRPYDSHKGNFGTLTVIAGSSFFRGAAALSVSSALRSGTGIVCLASTERVIESVAAKIDECIFFPLEENDSGSISAVCADSIIKKVNGGSCCLAGCGMVFCEDTKTIIKALIGDADCRLILDADALNSISENPALLSGAKYPPVITPHAGEMARLCGETVAGVKAAPEQTAIKFAREYNCIVVLKDFITHIASPSGELYVNDTGNAGLARGGSGDVLAGIIASFAAQGYKAYDAAVCGVYLHGLAADRCAARISQYGMLPSDILIDLCNIFHDNDR
jgi:NAD(P)H-hydrate epimerase